MIRIGAALVPLLGLALLGAREGEVRLRIAPYMGVDPSLELEAPGAAVRAIATPAAGGRVPHYSVGGEDVMWAIPGREGPARPGGYQCDVGPEMRLIPRHPVLWSGEYAWRRTGEAAFTLTSAPDPVLGLQLERDVEMDATGAITILQRMRNVTEGEKSYCLWDRTLCKAGGFTLIPLSESSRFPARWVLGKRNEAAWDYDGVEPAHQNVRVMDGVLVVRSQGPEQKVGADSDAGWIAYVRGRVLFVKYYPYDPGGRYSDGGLSVAHYYNEALAELEPISPEVTLAEGEEYVFPERWTIKRLDREVTTHEQARALVPAIPPSSFRD
jgi:hypothetical protein